MLLRMFGLSLVEATTAKKDNLKMAYELKEVDITKQRITVGEILVPVHDGDATCELSIEQNKFTIHFKSKESKYFLATISFDLKTITEEMYSEFKGPVIRGFE